MSISQTFCLFSQLLITLGEEADDNRDLSSFLKQEHFDDIIACVKKMANYALVSETVIGEQRFKKGFLQMKTGYILESAALVRNRTMDTVINST